MKVSKELEKEVLALKEKLRKAGTSFTIAEEQIRNNKIIAVVGELRSKYDAVDYDSVCSWDAFAVEVLDDGYAGGEYMQISGVLYKRKKTEVK